MKRIMQNVGYGMIMLVVGLTTGGFFNEALPQAEANTISKPATYYSGVGITQPMARQLAAMESRIGTLSTLKDLSVLR